MRRSGFATLLCLVLSAAGASPQEATQKVEIVRVTGCLQREAPDGWILSAATDPVAASRAAEPSQAPPQRTSGGNRYKLIGVDEFDLPSRKDHLVSIKGLLIKAAPVHRLNITSVTTVADSCPAAKK